ncbi:hypothetical protein NHX12_012485, partial [Muraenolepis orangiensis]
SSSEVIPQWGILTVFLTVLLTVFLSVFLSVFLTVFLSVLLTVLLTVLRRFGSEKLTTTGEPHEALSFIGCLCQVHVSEEGMRLSVGGRGQSGGHSVHDALHATQGPGREETEDHTERNTPYTSHTASLLYHVAQLGPTVNYGKHLASFRAIYLTGLQNDSRLSIPTETSLWGSEDSAPKM